MVDVCIIGGGVVGCAIARELSRFHLSIVLLERHSDVSEGTTKANSAIVHAGYDAKPGTRKARDNVAGNRIFASWCDELATPYRNNGSLVVAFTEEEKNGLSALLERGRTNGVGGLRLLEQDELRAREPNLAPEVLAALLAETGGICCPYQLTIDLATHALLNGVDIRLDSPVRSIRRVEGGFALDTPGQTVRCRMLVNAAGVHADTINDQLSEDRFRILPRRGEYWMIDKTFGDAFRSTIFQMPTALGKGVLITPTVEDTLIIGPNAEDIGDGDDVRTTAEGLAAVLRVARRSWPDMPGRQFITQFAGIRAHSDRDDFIVGRSADVAGYYLAAGMESPGLTAAPAIAVELAEMIADDAGARRKEDFLPPYRQATPFRLLTPDERAARVRADPAWGRMICRCEQITEAEIVEAIQRPLGARTVDGVKRRTRAGMGRCQGGFCQPRVLEILSRETGLSPLDLSKFGGGSRILSACVGQWPIESADGSRVTESAAAADAESPDSIQPERAED